MPETKFLVFINTEGGMDTYPVSTAGSVGEAVRDSVAHAWRSETSERRIAPAVEWAAKSSPGDSLGWGCGVIVNVTGGLDTEICDDEGGKGL